jgi:hypothetical protein
MDQLYPIIRRQRRPLVVADVPHIPTKPEPVQPVAIVPLVLVEPAESAAGATPKPEETNDEETNY